MMFHRRTSWAALFGVALVSGACSPSTGGGKTGSNVSSGGDANGSGVGGDTSGGGDTGQGGSNGTGGIAIIVTSGGSSSGGADGGKNCGGPSVQAERDVLTVDAGTIVIDRPVAMLIMLDQSLSMLEDGKVAGTTKWSIVKDGLKSFVNDSSSAGIDVALAVFPPPFSFTAADCNTGTGYDVPIVPMGPLPANASAIVGGLNTTGMPNGLGTPTEGGLRGAENFCTKYAKDHPDEDCVVVFATDGQPAGCNEDQTALAKIVSDARTNGGIKTFAIGMAAAKAGEVDFNFLNNLAIAGGTNCNPGSPGNEACNVGGGSDLTVAFNTIRKAVTVHQTKTVVKTTALACQFKTPDQAFDKDQVNVTFKDSQGQTESVLQAQSVGDCGKTASKAWYFDDNDTPTKILLCPDTCSAINDSDGGVLSASAAGSAPALDIHLGCPSKKVIIQ